MFLPLCRKVMTWMSVLVGASLAGVENAIMQDGKSPIFSADNEHRSHIVTHLALGTEIITQLQQQKD